tara:strand:- start:165 stop:521 length:357 start_codon:yes stop_codon:yes gene_type:complete
MSTNTFKMVNGQIVELTEKENDYLLDEKAESQKHLEEKAYISGRLRAYPSMADQLDTIYHNGIDAWREDIRAIKDQFPKPESDADAEYDLWMEKAQTIEYQFPETEYDLMGQEVHNPE